MTDTLVTIKGRTIALRRLEKELWPGQYTKADLLRYYAAVADVLLSHVRGRIISITRWPDGITGRSFFQKNVPPYAPAWLPSYRYHETRYMLLEDLPALVFLANLAALEIHAALWTIRQPEAPDLAVIDLDPTPPAGFREVRQVAWQAKAVLDQLGIISFAKTSGAAGLHIYIPLDGSEPYEVVREAVERLGRFLQRCHPGQITLERRIERRHGVYWDYGQNAPGRTMIAPYSPRPLPGAPVSTPISWAELPDVSPDQFTLSTVPARLIAQGDPWSSLFTVQQQLAPLRRL